MDTSSRTVQLLALTLLLILGAVGCRPDSFVQSAPGWKVIELRDGLKDNYDAAWQRTVDTVARNWDIKRMAIVDRNILRMAAYELLYKPDVPPVVAINEAIDLAKRYSTENSGSFVNGILDRIRANAPKNESENDNA